MGLAAHHFKINHFIMKKILLLSLIAGIFLFNACKDDDHGDHGAEYHIHFKEPANNASLKVGEMLHVHIEFEDHKGGTIHHVKVRAYHKATNAELFNLPAEAHVHKATPYEFKHDYMLSGTPVGTYVLEAKVWGHDDGKEEVTESREFSVTE